MFDVGGSQASAADNPVAGSSWPATLDGHCAHSLAKRDSLSHHRCITAGKSVSVVLFDLNRRPGAICFSRNQNRCVNQPIGGGAPQQIVLSAQVEVICNVTTA